MIDLACLASRTPHTAFVRQFRADVVRGLSLPAKELPCKYFYDEAGSALFERITRLDEYYLTRTEFAIMRRHARAMADALGPRCLLIEYGSGSSAKTRFLLDALDEQAAYVPVDVSAVHLQQTAEALRRDYPGLDIAPLDADFTSPLQLPPTRLEPQRRVIYFPGSTIGNLHEGEAIDLLRQSARLCGPGGGMLLGVDFRKDRAILESAYNDRLGVTAAFNRNLLHRINRELEADFAPPRYAHRAYYDDALGRIEMHLVSTCSQRVHLGQCVFTFEEGESIRTEVSHKYDIEGLHRLAAAAGYAIARIWTDDRHYFGVLYLTDCTC